MGAVSEGAGPEPRGGAKGNLVIYVEVGKSVFIGRDVEITVLAGLHPVTGRILTQLGIKAPPHLQVSRAERVPPAEHLELQLAREAGTPITMDEAKRRAQRRRSAA
ncbi:MAG TPA: hypothetical protein VIV56_07155 [Gemmatimonadales bacterium]